MPESIVAIDGRDALAAVIVRRSGDDRLEIQAFANGIDKATMAEILRDVVRRWERESGRSDT